MTTTSNTQYALQRYAAAPADDNEILKRFGHVVRRAALALAARTGVDADDLWSAGALGLLDAMKRYDPARGVKLEGFVSHRVRGAMLDELRRMDRLPRRLRGRVATLEKKRHELTTALGRAPSRDEIAGALDVDMREVDRLEKANEAHRPLEDAGPVASGDTHVDELIVGRERAAALRDAVATLTDRYQAVLSLRYVEELTLKEIAAVLGVSEPRVCQIHNAAVAKLRLALA